MIDVLHIKPLHITRLYMYQSKPSISICLALSSVINNNTDIQSITKLEKYNWANNSLNNINNVMYFTSEVQTLEQYTVYSNVVSIATMTFFCLHSQNPEEVESLCVQCMALVNLLCTASYAGCVLYSSPVILVRDPETTDILTKIKLFNEDE